MKVVFLFSGQGSHYRGMGQKLFEHNAVFRDSIEQSNSIINKLLNRSLIDELYEELKNNEFDDLIITHPAIVAIEIAMDRVLRDKGITPDIVSGNSLGEFAAAYSSNVWNHDMAIEATIEQAKSIVNYTPIGGMVAVVNSKRKDLEHVYNKYNLYLASDNFDQHFTLCGLDKDLNSLQSELDSKGIQYLRLEVKHPFHSPLIKEGFSSFSYYMATSVELGLPSCQYVSGINGEILKSLPYDHMWKAVSQYTDFQESVKQMEKTGTCYYIDLGPSGTSATFVKYNLPQQSKSKIFQIASPFKRELQQLNNLEEQLKHVVTA